MFYKILADGVVGIHFLWILFLIVGGFWGVKYKAVRVFHLFGLALALVLQVLDWYCPLTHLEGWLRAAQNPSLINRGSFIIYYVERLVYLEVSRPAIVFFTVLLCGVNGWVYCWKRRA